MKHILICLNLTLSLLAGLAGAEQKLCVQNHKRALVACAAHEHALNASALSIVSAKTRDRVVKVEEDKLIGMKEKCLELQRSCALACDDDVEQASVDGLDIAVPLEFLNDCRKGEVATHIRTIDQKIDALRRFITVRPAGRSAKNSL